MKRHTMNMFAATNEDLPIFSGFELTHAAEWNNDGTAGYCNECVIDIRPTTGGEYRVRVELTDYFTNTFDQLCLTYTDTLEKAQAIAVQVANSR